MDMTSRKSSIKTIVQAELTKLVDAVMQKTDMKLIRIKKSLPAKLLKPKSVLEDATYRPVYGPCSFLPCNLNLLLLVV